MTTIHKVTATVFLTDSNRTGDRTFAVLSGVVGNGNLLTEQVELPVGAVVADLTSTPGTLDQSVTLFHVEDDGVNELDEQPAKGDFIATLGPAPLLQAGQVSLVTDDDGGVVTFGIGMLLTMFPLLAEEWVSSVGARVAAALAEQVGPAVDAYLADLLEPVPESPTPETGDGEGEPLDVEPSGDGDPLPPADETGGEQESPGVDVGDPIDAPADGTETDLPAEPTEILDANDGISPDITVEVPAEPEPEPESAPADEPVEGDAPADPPAAPAE